MKPPIAKKIPKIKEIHGYREIDDYAWLADKTRSDPKVIAYLKGEDGYAQAAMRSTEDFQKTLYQEMLARIKETDVEVPYKVGKYSYYTRTEKGKQYPLFCRKKDTEDSLEEVTLNLNKMAEGHEFFDLSDYEVSDDGNFLAFSIDTVGFRQYTLHIKDLRTGKITENLAERVTSVAWANDSDTLFYTQEDRVTKRPHKFFRIRKDQTQQELLYEEQDELYRLNCHKTRSKGYLLLVSRSSTTSEVHYLPANQPRGIFRVFLERQENHEYYIDHLGKDFFIRTNDQGKNFRLAIAPVKDFSSQNWREIISHREGTLLEDIECFAEYFVTIERENGVSKFYFTLLKNGESHYIEFEESTYVIYPGPNEEFAGTDFRFSYESLTVPDSIFDYNVMTQIRTLLKQNPVLGGYDTKLYRSERIYATAPDKTKIPVSLVYKKELARVGSRPMLLEGYGAYGCPMDAYFSENRLSLLDRGVIFAIAHIRGGGDLGKDWHDQGKMMKKKNTFTDFIACADYLVKKKYTSPDQLIISGGSAGGLLMGAVTNMRPDLFRAAISYVPFVDVLNTMLDKTLPLTVGEYLEWGNPNEKSAYEYMRTYSPYDNIERKAYPPMLIRTSLHDSQVMYWEPAKYVAKLRSLKTDDNQILFKVKLEPGGHGGASGRYDVLRDTAFDYAYILKQMGIDK